MEKDFLLGAIITATTLTMTFLGLDVLNMASEVSRWVYYATTIMILSVSTYAFLNNSGKEVLEKRPHFWASMGLFLILLTAGTYGLIHTLGDSPEDSLYTFDFENRSVNGYVVLVAPNGFEEGKKVLVKHAFLTGDEGEFVRNFSQKRDPYFTVLKVDGSKDAGVPMPVTNYTSWEWGEERIYSFELSDTTRMGVRLRNSTRTPNGSEGSEIREIEDLDSNNDSQVILGFVAILALCFTIPSGIKAFRTLYEKNFDED